MQILNTTSRKSFWFLLSFALYLVGFFPLAYFRNDDWLHLGNSVVRLPHQWQLMWRPTQFFMDQELIHFFRPFVKLLVYFQYTLFGLHHYWWLVSYLLCFGVALLVTREAIRQVTQNSFKADAFCILMLASFHLHLGSILWVGEGVINAPQVFALSVCLLFFVKGVKENSYWFFISVFFYLFSLGIKESSVFFSLFLLGVRYAMPQEKKNCRFVFATFFALSGLYLFIRLGVMPFNDAYKPIFRPEYILRPIFYILLALFLVPLLFLKRVLPQIPLLKEQVVGTGSFLLFFALICAPYIGHDFFSPGWLLYPGFFFLAFTVLYFPEAMGKKAFQGRAIAILLLSVCLIVWQMQRLQWGSWLGVQKEVLNAIEMAPVTRVEKIRIFNCDPPKAEANLNRVIGGAVAVFHMWELVHGAKVPVENRYCFQIKDLASEPGILSYRWEFPNFVLIAKP